MLYVVIFLSSLSVWAEDETSEGFYNRDFLKMAPEKQNTWIIGAFVGVSGIIAMRDKEAAKCVYDWYFNDKVAEQNWVLLESMKKNPDIKPVAVIIYWTQKDCGNYWE